MKRTYTEAQKEATRARQRRRYAADPEVRRKSREATERWEAANPGAGYTPEYGRRKQMERRYGLTVEQYEALLLSQEGHCALCPAVQGTHKRRLTVDHDHKCCPQEKACGKCNRGILCANCNRMIGFLEAVLKEGTLAPIAGTWTARAIAYLKSYEPKPYNWTEEATLWARLMVEQPRSGIYISNVQVPSVL